MRSQRAGPADAGGGVGPPSEGWAAPSGEQGEETRRSMDGGAPAEDTTDQYIYSSINKSGPSQLTFYFIIDLILNYFFD